LTSPAPEPRTPPLTLRPASKLLLRRIAGIALRHFYLYRGSWPRLVEMLYWPMLNMAMYGFVSLSMLRHMGHADALTDSYLCGVMLGEVFLRTVMAMMVMYLEEVWSRNLGQLFASPLRLGDYTGSLIMLSMARCSAVIPAFCVVFWLFDFSILRLGWALPLYAALLCMSAWWYGLLVVSILMRFGLAAEWLGWMSTWLLVPFMAAYYPASILPHAFQILSWALPGTYVFESMRAQLATGDPIPAYLVKALLLNLGYFIGAALVFRASFRGARNSGGLLQMGE
jgi:ABC-2 type transport system permease protein